MAKGTERRFVICVDNADYPAALEVRKVYETLADEEAQKHQQIRVIDESGEDYLYPVACFVPIELPEAVVRVVSSN